MSRTRWLVLAVLALAVPFTIAACGGDDDGGGEDEDQITEAIEVSATEADPSACTEFQTQSFVEQTSGGTGEEAVERCRESQQEEPLADSVDVSDVEIDDGSASAVVALNGGFIDGQSLELGLAEEGGQWKLDELVGFAEFDRAKYVDSIVQGIGEETSGGPQLETCIRQRVEEVSDEQLQATFLENDETVFEETITPCFEGQEG
jgi:hypothetical protein